MSKECDFSVVMFMPGAKVKHRRILIFFLLDGDCDNIVLFILKNSMGNLLILILLIYKLKTRFFWYLYNFHVTLIKP